MLSAAHRHSIVMRGLDPPAGPKPLRRGEGPRIHHSSKKAFLEAMDRRVKPTAVRHDFCLMKCTALILLEFSWLRII